MRIEWLAKEGKQSAYPHIRRMGYGCLVLRMPTKDGSRRGIGVFLIKFSDDILLPYHSVVAPPGRWGYMPPRG